MDEELAKDFYGAARNWSKDVWPDDIPRARSSNIDAFRQMSAADFLAQYCWVVYASGFKVSTIKRLFPRLREAYYDFDLTRVAAMTSVERPMAIFRNNRKAGSFVSGANKIQREGFEHFKIRALDVGIDALQELPGIGKITKRHLARNTGLASVAKDDIWLVRVANALGASSVDDLANFLSNAFGDPPGVVDVVIWRFCAEAGWNSIDDSAVSSVTRKLGVPSSRVVADDCEAAVPGIDPSA